LKYLLTGLIILLVAYVGNIEPPAVGSVKVIDGTEHIYKCFQRTYRNGYEFDNEYKIVLYGEQPLIVGAEYDADAWPANPNLDPVLYDMGTFNITVLSVMETEGSLKITFEAGGMHTAYMEKSSHKTKKNCTFVPNNS
jgi:hypothetical protein